LDPSIRTARKQIHLHTTPTALATTSSQRIAAASPTPSELELLEVVDGMEASQAQSSNNDNNDNDRSISACSDDLLAASMEEFEAKMVAQPDPRPLSSCSDDLLATCLDDFEASMQDGQRAAKAMSRAPALGANDLLLPMLEMASDDSDGEETDVIDDDEPVTQPIV
jgi:hypothetical protein